MTGCYGLSVTARLWSASSLSTSRLTSMNNLSTSHLTSMNNLSTSHLTSMNNLSTSHLTSMNNLSTSHLTSMNNLSTSHLTSMNNLSTSHLLHFPDRQAPRHICSCLGPTRDQLHWASSLESPTPRSHTAGSFQERPPPERCENPCFNDTESTG